MQISTPNTAAKDIKATTYIGGATIKALGDGKVGGYLVVFGGPKDTQGEYFRPDCDFHLDWYGGARRPVLYHHGLHDQDIIEDIGFIYRINTDSHGVYAEAQLDTTNPRAQQVYNDIRRGRIGWSSGSAPHLSKVEDDGGISEWAIVEGSLTPTPAAGKRTTVQALKFDTSTLTPKSRIIEPSQAAKESQGSRGEREKFKRRSERKTTMNIKGSTGLIGAMQGAGIDSDSILKVLLAMEEAEGEAPESEMMDDMGAPAETMAAPDAMQPPAQATMAAPEDDGAEKGTNYLTEGDGGAEIEDTGSKPAMTPPAQGKPGTGATSAGKSIVPSGKSNATHLQQMMARLDRLEAQKTAPAKSKAAGGFQGNNPMRSNPVISNMKTAYHDLDAADMAFLYEMRRQGKHPRQMGVEFEREMASKAMKAYNANELTLDAPVHRKVAMKLDFNNTTVAGDGGSWVPDLWSSILWMRVRIDNNVAKNIEVFQMPSPTFEYPIESTDPTVYSVGESDTDAEQTLATNVFTRSKLAVTKLQFVAKKTGLQVGFSTEIEEDSIIPFIPQLRAQATRAFANSIDYNILNSDNTTGTGNINYKSGNTSSVSTANFLFGGGQGMRYNALVTNTNVGSNFQGGIPTLSGIRSARYKMISSTNAYAINPEDIVMITDPFTYGKFLGIDEINVYMNNGRDATVNTGMVPKIDGIPVYPSNELGLADSTGYITSANYPNLAVPSTSNLGQFVMFARQAWKVGYVRQVMTDVSYVPWNDSYILTMTARYAIGKKDTVACAVGYNILVV